MVLAFLEINPGLTLLLILVAGAAIYATKLRRLARDWQSFRRWQAAGAPAVAAPAVAPVPPTQAPSAPKTVLVKPTIPPAPFPIDFNRVDVSQIPGANGALQTPPVHLWHTIEYIRQYVANPRYTFPLGWWSDAVGELHLAVAHLVDDVYNGLITALPGGGKDNLILNIAYPLMMMYPPEALQFVVLDGKGGADYQGWSEKRHVWHVAEEGYELADAMELLSALKLSRKRWLKQVKASSWDNYRGPDRPPLVVVIISELTQLTEIMTQAEVEDWLMREINIWRGLGLRLLVGTQNSSQWSKKWRGAIEFFCAGRQPSRDEVKPNTGKDLKELEEMGVIPPNRLPQLDKARGVFTIVQGDVGVTVRTTFVDDEQRAYWVEQLPGRSAAEVALLQVEKDHLLAEWASFKTMIAQQEAERERRQAGVSTPQPTPPGAKAVPLVAERPAVMPSVVPSETVGYDRQALERLLADIQNDRRRKLDELVDHPLFVAACIAEFEREKTNAGVVRALWGKDKYSGDKNALVSATLKRIQEQNQQNEMLLNGLLAA